jgi:hypothetical protein
MSLTKATFFFNFQLKFFLKLKSLGAFHDGETQASSACPASLNNIMAPGQISTNLQNKNLFSSCSITQFKNTILSNNQ